MLFWRWARSVRLPWPTQRWRFWIRPYVSLGADLNASERATVLSLLGVTEEQLQNYTVVTVTNAEEHEYLDSYMDSSVIGTRALSSALVTGREAGNGIQVTTKNISYCTVGMYQNALWLRQVWRMRHVVGGRALHRFRVPRP